MTEDTVENQTLNGQQSNGDQSTPLATLIQLPAKFKLSDFNLKSPEVWFAAAEVIFNHNGVTLEFAKFASILQHLDPPRLEHIQSILCNPTEPQPYTKSKNILLGIYAKTPEKLEKLLSGASLTQTKPSLMLEEIKALGLKLSRMTNFLKVFGQKECQ